MDEDKGKKGFAGLSSLTSKVEDQPAVKEPERAPKPKVEKKETTSETRREPPRSSQSEDRGLPLPKKSSGSSRWKWALGIVGVIVVAAIYYNDQQSKPYAPPAPYKPKATPSNPNWSSSPSQATRSPSLKTAPSKKTPDITFEMPPVGQNKVHSMPQIRWCLREDMRMDVKRPLIDSNSEVAEFNQSVKNYNRRCGSFKYRRGNLERAKRQVEKLRADIERQAKRTFQPTLSVKPSSPAVTNLTPNPPKTPAPSPAHVREVQGILTQLGFDPGPVDGKFGGRTANAIKQFQRKSGQVADGKIDKQLLAELRAARYKAEQREKSSSSLLPFFER